MLNRNLIFTVLALTLPAVFGAPIPAGTLVNQSTQGGGGVIDATSQAITVPLNGAHYISSNDGAALKSKTTSDASSKRKSHKDKNQKHRNHKALHTPTTHSADGNNEIPTTPALVRRTTAAQVNSQITLGGVTFKLESGVGHVSSVAVFKTTFNGQSAYAKQNINDSKFAAEMENTKKASEALHSGLYLASGTAGGSQWLVTKAQPGKSFSDLVLEGKIKDKKAAVDKATQLVLKAQETLANGAKLIQGDTNTENWLFSEDLSKVYPIDMGITKPVPAWNTFLANSQKKEWEGNFDMTFDHYKKPSSGKAPSKPASKASSKSKSRRSLRSP